ncbi:hypothetical protein ACJIZ3_023493 [Penstemon smallii]|uniref:RING-type E3 ubiquitin transferase n=1 Tax=Penstemon smallii TaxID=265156 RepID=A0ABD3TQ66_9LAMI
MSRVNWHHSSQVLYPPCYNYYVIDSTIVIDSYSHHHHHPRSTRDRNYIATHGPRNVSRYHQNRRVLETNRNVEPQHVASGLIQTSQLDETLLVSSYPFHNYQEIINTSFIPQEEGPTTTDGLSESMIDRRLKTRDHVAMKNIGDEVCDICVVCQDDLYQENEKIGVVECGHEFHAECIKKWLYRKNFCPICKATALTLID